MKISLDSAQAQSIIKQLGLVEKEQNFSADGVGQRWYRLNLPIAGIGTVLVLHREQIGGQMQERGELFWSTKIFGAWEQIEQIQETVQQLQTIGLDLGADAKKFEIIKCEDCAGSLFKAEAEYDAEAGEYVCANCCSHNPSGYCSMSCRRSGRCDGSC